MLMRDISRKWKGGKVKRNLTKAFMKREKVLDQIEKIAAIAMEYQIDQMLDNGNNNTSNTTILTPSFNPMYFYFNSTVSSELGFRYIITVTNDYNF
jgi:hypothetical protein